MKKLRLVPIVLTLALAATLGGHVLTASAAAVILVDDDGQAALGNCNGTGAVSTTIQGGVNAAAAGDIVRVCPGTYNETVDVNKSITLQGAQVGVNAKTAPRTPGGPAESTVQGARDAGVIQVTASNAIVDGFTVQNNPLGPGINVVGGTTGDGVRNNIVTNNVFGVYGNGNGTFVQQNRIFNNNTAGSANGNGIYVDQGGTNLNFSQNLITDQQNAGILVIGDPLFGAGPVNGVTAGYNTITNAVPGSFIGAFGGANYSFGYNTMSNTTPDPAGNSGVFLADVQGASVANNTITKPNCSGIAVRDFGATPNSNIRLAYNTITGALCNGIDVTTAVANATTTNGNSVTASAENGILYGPATKQNRVISNTAKQSGQFDCNDLGTGNVWSGNKGNTSNPPGRCTP